MARLFLGPRRGFGRLATVWKGRTRCLTGHGASKQKAHTQRMFRLAYLSFVGAMVSTPVNLLTDLHQARWAIFGLMAAAAAFLTAGMMRRP